MSPMLSVPRVDGCQCHLVTPIVAAAVGLDEKRTSYIFAMSAPP
jgi:hypothetical protein